MIDLRSDTVTRPTPAMLKAMTEADLGDDVFDDDPTVDRLEALVAETLGKEASMFVPSGTQSNLAALMTHCGRGDEYLVGQQAHTYLFEGGGGATLAGLQPQPLDQEPDGTLDLEKLKKLIKPDDYHYARTRLLCLENTTWGKVLPQEYLARRQILCRQSMGSPCTSTAPASSTPPIDQGISAAEIASSIRFCFRMPIQRPRMSHRFRFGRLRRFREGSQTLAKNARWRHAPIGHLGSGRHPRPRNTT